VRVTLADVDAEIDLMRANPHDPEMQQSVKGMLYLKVLSEIANRRYDDAWKLAGAALKAEQVPVKWSACA